ncbi:hypothetical protein ACO0LD_28405 [Undibacterium sp. Ji83W]|uniref:hypothetical protein n=1 Tax=Undibacterium sp. Ji83W TaxID=3413043 RepID=UPI003BF3350B
MKTTLRHSFILLAAASNLLFNTPKAQAWEQKFDLEFRVLNSTKYAIDFCDTRPPDCRAVAPGDTYTNGQITNGKQIPNFYYWLYGTVIKICGKSMPLSRVITSPVSEKNDRAIVFYRMSITEESTQQLCRNTKQTTGKPL